MIGKSTRLLGGAVLLGVGVWAMAAPPTTVSQKTKADKPARAIEQQSGDEGFVRLTRDDNGSLTALQTAIVRYVPTDKSRAGLSVDLVAAVHVGERSYYEQLNREFEQYDALLYELVAPEEDNVPMAGQGTSSGHPIGLLQNGLKDLLELEHQLARVNYERPNFVHADMSPEEFANTMASRDESLTKLFLRLMGQGIAQQSKQQAKKGATAEAEMMAALFSKERAVKLKRIMAEQFGDLEEAMAGLDGPDGSTIITERNRVALEVLQEQIDAGKRKLGIFYGAGHLKDMQEHLEKDFGLQRQETRWVTAWDLRTAKQKKRDERRNSDK